MKAKLYVLLYVYDGYKEVIGIFDNVESYLKVMNSWAIKEPDAFNPQTQYWEIKEVELNHVSIDEENTLESFGMEAI